MKDIFIVVFATLSVCFAASYTLVLRQSVKLKRDVSKLFIEKTLLQEYADLTRSTKIKEDSDDSIHKENFIKFLSDSRIWAFDIGFINFATESLKDKYINLINS